MYRERFPRVRWAWGVSVEATRRIFAKINGQSKSSNLQVSSKPALWSRTSMRRCSRQLISSARMISRKEA